MLSVKSLRWMVRHGSGATAGYPDGCFKRPLWYAFACGWGIWTILGKSHAANRWNMLEHVGTPFLTFLFIFAIFRNPYWEKCFQAKRCFISVPVASLTRLTSRCTCRFQIRNSKYQQAGTLISCSWYFLILSCSIAMYCLCTKGNDPNQPQEWKIAQDPGGPEGLHLIQRLSHNSGGACFSEWILKPIIPMAHFVAQWVFPFSYPITIITTMIIVQPRVAKLILYPIAAAGGCNLLCCWWGRSWRRKAVQVAGLKRKRPGWNHGQNCSSHFKPIFSSYSNPLRSLDATVWVWQSVFNVNTKIETIQREYIRGLCQVEFWAGTEKDVVAGNGHSMILLLRHIKTY